MTVTYRSFDEALAIANADTRSRHAGADISKASYFYHRNSIITAARMGATGVAKNLYNATRPDLATGEELDALAGVFGITRKPATTAIQMASTVAVTGTGAWLTTLAATTAAGLAFEASWGGSWTAAGNATVYWDSTTTGAANNLGVGAELTITTPPGGMESTATVSVAPSIHAIDAESDSELQQRLSDLFAAVATSGNEGAFWSWVLNEDCDRQLASAEFPPMQEAYIYPQIRGVLTMEAVPLIKWDGVTKIPTAGAMTEVETYVDTVKTTGTDFDCVKVAAQGVDVRLTLTTDDGYGRDWGAAATTYLDTDGVLHTSTKLFLTADPTGTTYNIVSGNKILIMVGTNYYPNVRTVAAVSSVDNSITVTEPFADEDGTEVSGTGLGATRTVRPAGPITQACVDAVLDLFGKMTPGDTVTGTRFPRVDQAHPEDLTDWMFQRSIIDASSRVTDVTVNTGATAATAAALVGAVLEAYILAPDGDDGGGGAGGPWLRIEFSNLNS